jgi:gamma-butyrobetaine dioxygenase
MAHTTETGVSTIDLASVSPAWARDACTCEECRDPHNDQHLIAASDLVGWVAVAATEVPSGWAIDLRHGDGREHRCQVPSTPRPQRSTVQATWGATHIGQLRPGASDITEFSTRLAEFGIAMIEGQGSAPNTVLDFAAEIGFVRSTNYGDLFDVIAEAKPSNLAFTNVGLPLHTDNPYRDPVPTVQLLHCLHSAEQGGGSVFVDGFRVAAQFRELDPVGFELLATTPVPFEFRDDAVLLRAEVPLIRLDARGDVDRVTINNRSMRPVDSGSSTAAFYDAYISFTELLASAENTITFSLRSGEIVGFDNRRVLHGRSGFAGGGARHLQGCYIDMDAIVSTATLAAPG